jgi:hypothetical protein
MKTGRIIVSMTVLFVAAALTLPGCFGGDPEAKAKVDQAIGLIASSQPLMEDLLNLDRRFNTLGTRFSNVEDTIAEGKSLAEMALFNVEDLESRYRQARELLREVAGNEGGGDYAEYARIALAAVDVELEALAVNRRLLTAAWDMLDLLPLAESEEQLSYYTGEIDRLTREVSELFQRGAEKALEADRYYEEKGL